MLSPIVAYSLHAEMSQPVLYISPFQILTRVLAAINIINTCMRACAVCAAAAAYIHLRIAKRRGILHPPHCYRNLLNNPSSMQPHMNAPAA
jgi:hypothetical protein